MSENDGRGFSSGLTTELLPARQGDCVLVTWRDGVRPHHLHHLLVDAGPGPAYDGISRRLESLDRREVDLVLLTHVDADHIEGLILLVNDSRLGLSIDEVWYNGAAQLGDELGAVQGEILGMLITERGLGWNTSFQGAPVVAPDGGDLPVRELPGEVRVTVLAPDLAALRRLRDVWGPTCKAAGLTMNNSTDALAALRARPRLQPMDSYLDSGPVPDVRALARSHSGADTSVPNASSIVVLVERGDDRILLAGDSTPAVLLAAVKRLLAERGLETLPLTTFKLPHHGSVKNITPELVRLLPAERYLISTDGSYFQHPDDAAIAMVLEYGPAGLELVFNYDTPRNRRWEHERLRTTYQHHVSFPTESSRAARQGASS